MLSRVMTGVLSACATECRKWAGILLTPRLRLAPATMSGREGLDLRVGRLVDGSALLYVPHGARTGMFYCEVETALDMRETRADTEFLVWVGAGGWTDSCETTVTGRKKIYVGAHGRRLGPWMAAVAKWRMERNAELDESMRHYRNFHFMSLLNHLWDAIQRTPKGFVERWALRGPAAAEEAWAEAETVYPKIKGDVHRRALFDVLIKEAQ